MRKFFGVLGLSLLLLSPSFAQTVFPIGGGSSGGGGTPGGSATQLQYNNAGAFGGITGATTNGTALTLVAPVLGAATGTSLTLGGAALGGRVLAVTGSGILSAGLDIGGSLAIGGSGSKIRFSTDGGTGIRSISDGVLLFFNNAENDFTAIKLGLTTSAAPGIFRNGAGIDFKLADNSAFANIAAALITSNAVGGAAAINILGGSFMTASAGSGYGFTASGVDIYYANLGQLRLSKDILFGWTNSATNATGVAADAGFARLAAANIRQGLAPSATPLPQIFTLGEEGLGTDIAGTNGTLQTGRGTGAGASSNFILQTPTLAGTSATVQAYATRLTVDDTLSIFTNQIRITNIGSDAALTDTTVCQDTTNHQLYSGSGTLGVCLGTSSVRYKHDVLPQDDGLNQILALKPVNFFYKAGFGDSGAREQYGFLAEDVVDVLPKLVPLDNEQKPNSVDILGMVPVLVKAMQEQQVEINSLKFKLRQVQAANDNQVLFRRTVQ